jgi:uncharacterized caspase-like protein
MTRWIVSCLILAGLALSSPYSRQAFAEGGEPRIALVIGNADYRETPLTTAANDAGLVADALRAVGFEVTGAANLDQDALRRAFREFRDKAAQAGPDAIAFVYLAGRGLQYEGENYFAPIDAVIARAADAPIEALRISDFTRSLAALPLRARIVALDAARANDFAGSGPPLAGGLALVDAEPGALYAFNAAPGAIAPLEPGPYSHYAQALAEMLREGAISVDEAFARVRLRVDEVTRGAVTPWDVSKIDPPLVLLPGDPDTAPLVAAKRAAARARPIRDYPVEEAYAAAIERDTFAGYQDFLAAYPNGRFAARVRSLLAARREAITWRRAVAANGPNAYWTYMQRYPRGPHFADARRRLIALSAPLEPPPRFDVYEFEDLPPPPEAEYEIIDRPIIIFEADDYPPPPVYFLPPRPREFIDLPPPPPPPGRGFLPIPIPIPLPLPYARPHAPQGVVIQPNFGQQQGPMTGAGPGGHRGAGGPAADESAAPPLAPGQRPQHPNAQTQAPPPAIVPPAGAPPAPLQQPAAPPAVKPAPPPAQPPAASPSGQVQPSHAPAQGAKPPTANDRKGRQQQLPPPAGAPGPGRRARDSGLGHAQPSAPPDSNSAPPNAPSGAPPSGNSPAPAPQPKPPGPPSPARPAAKPGHVSPQGKKTSPAGAPKDHSSGQAAPPGVGGSPSPAGPKAPPRRTAPNAHPLPAGPGVGHPGAVPMRQPARQPPRPPQTLAPKPGPLAKPVAPAPQPAHQGAPVRRPTAPQQQMRAPAAMSPPAIRTAPPHPQPQEKRQQEMRAQPPAQRQSPPQMRQAPPAKPASPPNKPAPPKPGADPSHPQQ